MAKKSSTTRRLPVLATILFLLALPLSVFVLQQNQDVRQKAAEGCVVNFSDLPASLAGAIICTNQQACIIKGTGSSFNPNAIITRADAVAFIARYHVEVLTDWEYKTPTTPSFTDVSNSHPLYKEIETARHYGFILGYGSAFGPNDPWRFGFHGVWRDGSTDKYGNRHSQTEDCHPSGQCYKFEGSTNEQVTRGAFVSSLFTYATQKGSLSSCAVPTNTSVPPTATAVPTATPNTPIPTIPPVTPTPILKITPIVAGSNCTPTELGCISNDPIQFAGSIYGIGLGLIGGIALLFIMFGGYLIMTSRGDYARVKSGKSYILYAILGLLLAIFGYVLLTVTAVDILQIPGFSK